MLDSNPPDAVKRYAPPSQRNRTLNRRKSAENFEKVNYTRGIEGEKGQGSYLRNSPAIGHAEAGNNILSEPARAGLIPLNGCSISEVSQLLNERKPAVPTFKLLSCNAVIFMYSIGQAAAPHNDPLVGWAAAWNSFNDPSVDLSGGPVMYSGASGSSWGHLKFPHQMDFLRELRRAVQNAPGNAVPPAGERN